MGNLFESSGDEAVYSELDDGLSEEDEAEWLDRLRNGEFYDKSIRTCHICINSSPRYIVGERNVLEFKDGLLLGSYGHKNYEEITKALIDEALEEGRQTSGLEVSIRYFKSG